METKVKNWSTGDGSVILTYSGQDNGTIIVESDMNTSNSSRSMTISARTGNITRNVTVNQSACPVNFRVKDGGLMQTSNGGWFAVQDES